MRLFEITMRRTEDEAKLNKEETDKRKKERQTDRKKEKTVLKENSELKKDVRDKG